MKLASGFCIPEPLPMHTSIKGRQVNPLSRFLLRSRVDEKCADLHKPFISYLFLVGVTVQSAESLSAAIPLGTSTKRENSKRANHRRSRLFQDAVLSVSFWLRSFPVRGGRTWSLSSVSGLPTRWRCVRGRLMRLLWSAIFGSTWQRWRMSKRHASSMPPSPRQGCSATPLRALPSSSRTHWPPLPGLSLPSPWAPSCVLQSCSAPGWIDT